MGRIPQFVVQLCRQCGAYAIGPEGGKCEKCASDRLVAVPLTTRHR